MLIEFKPHKEAAKALRNKAAQGRLSGRHDPFRTLRLQNVNKQVGDVLTRGIELTASDALARSTNKDVTIVAWDDEAISLLCQGEMIPKHELTEPLITHRETIIIASRVVAKAGEAEPHPPWNNSARSIPAYRSSIQAKLFDEENQWDDVTFRNLCEQLGTSKSIEAETAIRFEATPVLTEQIRDLLLQKQATPQNLWDMSGQYPRVVVPVDGAVLRVSDYELGAGVSYVYPVQVSPNNQRLSAVALWDQGVLTYRGTPTDITRHPIGKMILNAQPNGRQLRSGSIPMGVEMYRIKALRQMLDIIQPKLGINAMQPEFGV